jgi:peptidyl-prolyl cis-trans isomerase SurA
MQEYRDGILLFEVINNEVWDKSSLDTLGLEKFFDENKTKYAWDKPHYKGYVILAKDSKVKKKMQKEVAKLGADAAVQYLLDNYRTDSISSVKIEKGLFVQKDNQYVDELIFKSGKATYPEGFSDFFLIGNLLPDSPESYTDVR